MKRIATYISAVLAAALAACSDVEPYGKKVYDEAYITVTPQTVTLDDLGKATVKVDVPSDMYWGTNGWSDLNIEEDNGYGSSTVVIADNYRYPHEDDKNVNVTFHLYRYRYKKEATLQVIVPATQVTMNPKAPVFSSAASSQSVTINANFKWSLYSKSNWLELSQTDGTRGTTQATLEAKENPSTEAREGYIEFRTGDWSSSSHKPIYHKITVTQQGANAQLTLSPENLDFTYEETYWSSSRKNVHVNTNVPSWKVGEISYKKDADEQWVTYSAYSSYVAVGVKSNNHRNERKASMEVKAGGLSRTISITQGAAPENLSVSPNDVTFLANGVQKGYTSQKYADVDVTTNVDGWKATANRSWINLNRRSDGILRITVDEYSDTSSDRSGTITVKGESLTQTITVTQKAKDGTNINRDDFGQDKSLD